MFGISMVLMKLVEIANNYGRGAGIHVNADAQDGSLAEQRV
jgi:hypothetical protein